MGFQPNRQVSVRSVRIGLMLCASVSAAFSGGCLSREKVARQFEQNRQRSYELLVRSNGDPNDVSAIEVIDGPLSLAKAIKLAFEHNKDIQAARLKVVQAKGRMLEAASTALPELTLSGSALAHEDESLLSSDETYQLTGSVRQPLYLGGLAKAAVDAAVVFGYMSDQELRQTIQATQLRIRRKYLDALLGRELLRVAEQAKSDAQEHLADVRKKLKYGVGTRFDVLRAEVRVRAIEAERINLGNAYAVAVADLLNAVGVSQLSHVELTDSLEFTSVNVSGEECFRVAMANRPDLLIAESMVRLAADNVLSEQSSNRPKVFLEGTYQQDYPGFDSSIFGGGDRWQRSMSGGITVEWPIFDGLRTDGLVTQARAELQRQEVALRRMDQQVQFEVNQALLNLRSSEEFVQSQLGNVDNAKEALRLARVNFRRGNGTSLDVISAELGLSKARSDYNTAVHGYRIALLNLHWAVGTLGEREFPLAGPARQDRSAGSGLVGAGDRAPAEPDEAADRVESAVNVPNAQAQEEPDG